jgi:hypothetical protein
MQKKKKNTAFTRLALAFATPSFHVELDRVRGGFSVMVYGVLGISEFSPSRVVLILSDGEVVIEGEKLQLAVYEGNSAEVCGGVFDVGLKFKN